MLHFKKLLGDRVDFLRSSLGKDERDLDELLRSCEKLSSRIKAGVAEIKELTQYI